MDGLGTFADVVIQAAGGVVWRVGRSRLEVLAVHRPARDDWSLPKGKRIKGESLLDCALREVGEETGLLCEPGPELSRLVYRNRRGHLKHVHYWAMTVVGGAFVPNREVDAIAWLPLERAHEVLTHNRDVAVAYSIEEIVAVPAAT